MAQSKKQNALKNKRHKRQVQTNRNRWLRIGGVVFLVIVVLGAIGVWRNNVVATSENQIENLKMFAGILELNQADFDQCLDSGLYRGLVSQHQQAALNAGARGTPSFYVNGEAVISPTYQTLASVIENQLTN